MKRRVCQTVKNKCRNLRTGVWCVLAVSTVVICTSISAAWAQHTARVPRDPNSAVQPRTRTPQETTNTQTRIRQPQENPVVQPRIRTPREEQLAIEGQRAALKAVLEAVRDVASSTEAALREQGDTQDDVTLVLDSELAEIQSHIRQLERRLASLDRPSVTRQRNAETATPRSRIRNADEPATQTPTVRNRTRAGGEQPAPTRRRQTETAPGAVSERQ